MNLRHMAGIALVGWYLMVPPMADDGVSVDTKAPLSDWYNMKPGFASKQDCEDTKAKMISLHPHPSSPDEQLRHEGAQAALCVPSDDPRLKGK
jgi:hypothetical protein